MIVDSQSPLISVIMPVYNCERYVELAVGSILSQTYCNFELLIVDDGSNDKSWHKINSINDTRISKFRFHINKGNVSAINFLLGKAKGDYITFQDADDWSDESRLMIQKDFLEKHEEIHLCATGYNVVDVHGGVVDQISFPSDFNAILEFIRSKKFPPVCCASMMFRNIVLQEIGFYREYFNRLGSADFDWYYRVICKFRVCNIHDVLYFYRRNLSSITKTMTLDPRKIHSEKIAFFLFNQRLIDGSDSLDNESNAEIDFFLISYLRPYEIDKTLIYRQNATHNMNKGFYYEALKIILKSIFLEPIKKSNWSHFKFLIWKYFCNRTNNLNNV
jgi:glycosyltransferase involved in cell wall biosynthesis